ncbi:MAG: GNAT family N-acetyltransferase [Lachnospiraceae bacterium]|nr:GNAT family N-acetyltransferase [Lachnospiraceae bacterium]
MVIRQATCDEMLKLWEYENLENASPTARFFFNNIATGNAEFWTTDNNSQLISELYVFRNLDDNDFANGTDRAYLCAFRVKKEYRGRGIGTRLINEVMSNLRSEGIKTVTIGVAPDENDNIRLYQRLGFDRKVKDCYEDPCAMDENMNPKPDEMFWLLAKNI